MPAGLHAAAVLALLLVVAMVRAEITSFCKCTCGPNSIILELTREGLSNLPLAQEPIDLDSLSPIACMNCTRALCSKANRDLCNDAGANEEITPLCFQRDSIQDRVIVVSFITLLFGLLVYALCKPQISSLVESLRVRLYTYRAVPASQQ